MMKPFHMIWLFLLLSGYSVFGGSDDANRMKSVGLFANLGGNAGKSFTGTNAWLQAAGVTHEQMIELVRRSITDGQVCDWVRHQVQTSDAQKQAHAEAMLGYPKPQDAAMQDRLRSRKEAAGLAHRDDIKTFVDFIDADERR